MTFKIDKKISFKVIFSLLFSLIIIFPLLILVAILDLFLPKAVFAFGKSNRLYLKKQYDKHVKKLEGIRRLKGKNSLEYLKEKRYLAILCFGKYEKKETGLTLIEEVCIEAKKVFGPNDTFFLSTSCVMGDFYFRKQERAKGIKILEGALLVWVETAENDIYQRDFVQYLEKLFDCYVKEKQTNFAMNFGDEILSNLEKWLGSEHDRYLKFKDTILQYLDSCLIDFISNNDDEDALELINKLINYYGLIYGANGFLTEENQVRTRYFALISAKKAINECVRIDAINILKAMEAEKKVIPHRDVVEKLHEHINIALQQSLSGDFQKAISILKYSLEYGKINGVSEYDYDILKIQFMIGSFYYATKKLDIALQTILPAFENLNKRYGNYSIDSSLLFLTVFGIYWDLGQIEEAKTIGMTGLKNIIKIEGKNKPKFKICYDEIYKRYKNAGDEDGMKELQDLHIS